MEWRDGALVLDRMTSRGALRHRFSIEGERLAYAVELIPAGESVARTFVHGAYRRISGH